MRGLLRATQPDTMSPRIPPLVRCRHRCCASREEKNRGVGLRPHPGRAVSATGLGFYRTDGEGSHNANISNKNLSGTRLSPLVDPVGDRNRASCASLDANRPGRVPRARATRKPPRIIASGFSPETATHPRVRWG